MKRLIKYLACLLAIVVLVATVFIIFKLNKKFPDEIVYDEYMQAFSDNGIYFIKNSRLCFLDNATGQSVIVCNRANCEHNDESCNAYIPGMAADMLVYDGYIYMAFFESEIFISEDGEITNESKVTLTRLDMDGSHRKDIYTADSGAVLSMMAIGDTIYFTEYTQHGEDEVNVYNNDNALYAYNIRWDKLKCIKKYPYTEEKHYESVEIIGNCDDNTLYILHQYRLGGTGVFTYLEGEGPSIEDMKADGTNISIIEKVNKKTGSTSEIQTFEDTYLKFFVDKDKRYIQISDYYSETDILTLWECDDHFAETKELFTAEDARVDWLGEYMYVIASDYLKALYDCEEDRWYIAKTLSTQEGTDIPDTKKVDRDKNIIYIDATDYTGYKAGDLLPGDISNYAVREWSVFLEENYIPYEDLTEEQRKSLTWIDIK